jgi:hypothetical protein
MQNAFSETSAFDLARIIKRRRNVKLNVSESTNLVMKNYGKNTVFHSKSSAENVNQKA